MIILIQAESSCCTLQKSTRLNNTAVRPKGPDGCSDVLKDIKKELHKILDMGS